MLNYICSRMDRLIVKVIGACLKKRPHLAGMIGAKLLSNPSLASHLHEGARIGLEAQELEKLAQILRLTPMGKFQDEDVFIAGYPKSGNTWFQNLAAGVVYGIVAPFNTDTVVQELVPDIGYKPYYRRYSAPMFFKTHDLPAPAMRRVVLLVRDGRDVMVSFFHHCQALSKEPLDFQQMMKQGQAFYTHDWHEHIETWMANPYQAKILTVRYEDLHADPVAQLQRFCQFIGLDRDETFLRHIVKVSSFKEARTREQTQGWDDPRWPKSKPFVRRGVVGSYRDEMPPEVLKTFLQKAGPTLTRVGYAA